MSSKGSYSRRKRGKFRMLLIILAVLVTFKAGNWDSIIGLKNGPQSALAGSAKDDWNRDGVVDLEDLKVFSAAFVDPDWQSVDWCLWLDSNDRAQKHMGSALETFIREYFQCDGEPPDITVLRNVYPMRLALGPAGNLYVTDPKIGSVFVYDVDFNIISELRGLDKPLGVAVDDLGNIYVGSSSRNVEVYDAGGVMTATIGKGLIKMPNDLTFDRDGRLYVADSKKDTIWVFDSNGAVIRSIGTPGEGDGQFKFPVAVEIAYYVDGQGQEVGELYVADHGHSLIQVFDLGGNFLRSFGGIAEMGGMMGTTLKWKGKFVSIKSLAIDSMGNVHALDCLLNKVQILDPVTGAYISHYGEYGTEPGQLNLPMDIIIDGYAQTIVAEARNKRVEIIYTIP